MAVVVSAVAAFYRSLSPAQREAFIASLDPEVLAFLRADWRTWGRADQQWSTDIAAMFTIWCCGRGWGKTRTGAEAARWVGENPLAYFGHRDPSKWRGVLVGRTAGDVHGTMLYGPSGIMTITPQASRPVHVASHRLLIWPSGVQMLTCSADEPDQLRGPTFAFAWADELCTWPLAKRAEQADAWDNLVLGLREPASGGPRCVVTTTPRNQRHLAKLVDRFKAGDKAVHVVFGSTFDNRANLAPEALREFEEKYKGTRLERQELWGEVLLDNPSSLWPDAAIFRRVEVAQQRGETYEAAVLRELQIETVGVAIDPSVAGTPGSAETGIVVGGRGRNGKYYVLEDASVSPERFAGPSFEKAWARAAVEAARRWRCTSIVGEVNNGGKLVEANVRSYIEGEAGGDPGAPLRFGSVWASDAKRTRAEPVAMLYQQGRVLHVGGPRTFLALEAALHDFDPTLPAHEQPKPVDRMDALVWLVTYLQDAKVVRSWSALASASAWSAGDDEDLDDLRIFR